MSFIVFFITAFTDLVTCFVVLGFLVGGVKTCDSSGATVDSGSACTDASGHGTD